MHLPCTVEGLYDYENSEYIYQYKDHFVKVKIGSINSKNVAEIIDKNYYCPFVGTLHLITNNFKNFLSFFSKRNMNRHYNCL